MKTGIEMRFVRKVTCFCSPEFDLAPAGPSGHSVDVNRYRDITRNGLGDDLSEITLTSDSGPVARSNNVDVFSCLT
jgi:hypothetical protein